MIGIILLLMPFPGRLSAVIPHNDHMAENGFVSSYNLSPIKLKTMK